MDEAGSRNTGPSVLDGVVLVIASAIASVHLKTPVDFASGVGWGLVWLTFGGVALTTAGPLLWLVRKYIRRLGDYPGPGDSLWALLGAPWILCSPLRTPEVGGEKSQALGVYGMALTLSMGAACLIVLGVLWKTWVLSPPQARSRKPAHASWTNRLGLILAVSWPLQCGFLLVVLDSKLLPPAG